MGGPLFDPFVTVTNDIVWQEEFDKYLAEPLDEETKKLVDVSTTDITDYDVYPSPVDLPNFNAKAADKYRSQMQEKISAAEQQAELAERRTLKMNNFNPGEYGDYESINEIPDSEWVPDRAIEAIMLERQMEPDISDTALANKIMKENLPIVAANIVHTAKYANDPRIRLQAGTYVMDRMMGKVGNSVVTEDSPLDTMTDALMKLVAETADTPVVDESIVTQ